MRLHVWIYTGIVFLFFPVKINGQSAEQALQHGQKHLRSGDRDQATVAFKRAYDRFMQERDSSRASVASLKLAECQVHSGDINTALTTYDLAIDLAYAAGNDSVWSNAQLAKSTIFQLMGQKPRAVALLKRFIDSPIPGDHALYGAYVVLANSFRGMGELDSALYYLGLASEIDNSFLSPMNQSALHQSYGNIYSSLNQYDQALYHYLQGIEYYPSHQDSMGLSNIFVNVGQLYYVLGQPEEAHHYLSQGLSLAERKGSSFIRHIALHRLANLLKDEHQMDSAVALMGQSLDYFRASPRKNYAFWVAEDLTRLHWQLGNRELANQYLELCRELENTISGRRTQLAFELLWADHHLREKNFSKSAFYLDRAEKIALNMGSPYSLENVLERKARLYAATGEFQQAYITNLQVDSLENSLFNATKTRIVNEMQTKYDKEKQAQKIQTLSLENQIQQLQIKRGQTRTIIAIVSALLLAILLFIIYRQYKKIRGQHKTISASLQEKETLLREIHHRVKNNLQVVSSLLFLQSEYVDDASALAALREGRNRVKSMSLIHQHLYQDDHLIGVNTQTYFEKLVGSLFNSYRVDRNRVSFTTDIEPVKLDIDTLVPLALIVNELVSNSLKHAFPGDSTGAIRLELSNRGKFLELRHEDNGVGLDKPWPEYARGSFGYQLISLFAKKLNGNVSVTGERGFHFNLRLERTNHAGS